MEQLDTIKSSKRTHHYLSARATKEDVLCLHLGRLGFTWEAIAKSTGLSFNQVGYRLNMAGIKPSSYRRGETELARKIMEVASEDSKKYFSTIVSTLKHYLKEK